MPASYTSRQPSNPRRHPSAELRRNGATLSLARRAIESGHLLHSEFTCPSSRNARVSNRETHLLPAAQQVISSSDNNNRSAVECSKVGVHYETPSFHPRPTLPEWYCQA